MRNICRIGLLAALAFVAGCGTSNSGSEAAKPEAAQPPPQEEKKPLAAFTIEVRHADYLKCDAREKDRACKSADHWTLVADGTRFATAAELDPLLQKEANLGKDGVSEREVLITGDPSAPWKVIADAMIRCAVEGIYKISWQAALPASKAENVPAWLPHGNQIRGTRILEEVRVYVRYGADGESLNCKVNAVPANDTATLVKLVGESRDRWLQNGKTDVPVIIDANSDVPWSNVITLTKLFLDSKFEPIDFAAPVAGPGVLELEKPAKVMPDVDEDEPAIFFPDAEEDEDPAADPPVDRAEESRFGFREFGAHRAALIRGGGTTGADSTESAVTAGLRWLARHQAADGHWSSSDFDTECPAAKCTGDGYSEYDAGQTGLALLAFFAAGHTHLDKNSYVDPHTNKTIKYGDVVRNGIKWLIAHQNMDGSFGDPKTSKFMYNHAIAAMAMAEAYGMTNSAIFKEPAQKGIDFLIDAQSPGKGWRYAKQDAKNDTSVTGWCVMALHSAVLADLKVDRKGFLNAKAWIEEVTDEKHFKVGYTALGTGKVVVVGKNEDWDGHEAMSAIGMVCRAFIDRDKKDVALEGSAKLLVADLPNHRGMKIDYYYWYYGSLALFQWNGPDGKYWQAWNDAMKTALIPNQHKAKDGCLDGSWDPDVDRWGFEGGRIFSTAINVLTLETYYRYANAFKAEKKK